MGEEERWAKVRQIVREECERIRDDIVATLQKHTKSKIGFKNGFFTGLGEIEMAALEATYPAVDVKKEIREAATWIVMNPGDAPKSNYGAFVNRGCQGTKTNTASGRSRPEMNYLNRSGLALIAKPTRPDL
jgi:hypothetical protein